MSAMIFLGGGESPQQKKLVAAECPHILISYYWLQKLKPPQVKELFDRYPAGVKLMVDSGAYTLRQDNPSGPWADKSNLFKYADKYETFLHTYRKRLFSAVHLDIGNRLGQKQVDAWDKNIFKVLEDEGLPIIKVYHEGEHSNRDWQMMCERHPYVGITGFEGLRSVSSLFTTARKYKTKVHGFAMTKFEAMKKLPFYSVDSVTWIMGEKYGDTFVFRANRLHRFEDKKLRRQFKTKFASMGLDWDKIKKEEPTEIAKMNLGAWLEAQRWLDKNTQRLNYWESTDTETLAEQGAGILETLPAITTPKREPVVKAIPSAVVARRYDPALFPGRPSEERGKPFAEQLKDMEERRWRSKVGADKPQAIPTPKKGVINPLEVAQMAEQKDELLEAVISDRNVARPMIVDQTPPSPVVTLPTREVPVIDTSINEANTYTPEQQAVYAKALADGLSVLEAVLCVSNMHRAEVQEAAMFVGVDHGTDTDKTVVHVWERKEGRFKLLSED